MRKIACCCGGTLLAVLFGSCNNTPPTAAPTPTPIPAPTPSGGPIISGVVLAGTQPIQGAHVDHGYGPNGWVVTDANGLFQLPENVGVETYPWVRAGKQDYVQPCAAPWTPNAPVTVQLVPRGTLTGTPLPSASGFRTISGVVVRVVNGVKQTMAGVSVDFEPGQTDDWPAAYTITDANGQFSLCGLPDVSAFISAYVNASVPLIGTMTVPPGQTTIELTVRN